MLRTNKWGSQGQEAPPPPSLPQSSKAPGAPGALGLRRPELGLWLQQRRHGDGHSVLQPKEKAKESSALREFVKVLKDGLKGLLWSF